MRPFIRFFLNLRFKNKLLLSYIVVVLIPVVTWVIYSFNQTNHFIIQQTETSFRNIAATSRTTLEQKLRKIENAFELVTSDTTMMRIINGHYASNYEKYYDITYKFDPMVNALKMMNSEIRQIDIFTNGDIKNARANFIDLDEAKDKFRSLSVVNTIDPVWSYGGGQLSVAQQVLSLDEPGQSAIVSLDIDANYIFSNNVSAELENYGMMIVDGAGHVVYGEDRLKHPVAGGKATVAQVEKLSRSNDDFLLFHEEIYPKGWELYLYTDTRSSLISFGSAFRSTLLITLIVVTLIFIVILLFSRTFVRRIARLNRLLAGVVSGGFEANIASGYRDEIGEITNSIGAMVKQTRQLIDELHISHTQQREAEIKALQSQINPHFLYNTLSTINWKAMQSGNEDISKIAVALSAFYRSTLNRGQMVTTVENELAHVRAYLDIQLSSSHHAFDVMYAVEDRILEYDMPGIILQPIVENAIEHGLSIRLARGEKGALLISVYEQGNDILFEVVDNGEGMSDDTVRDVLVNGKKGYGLHNVDHRLKLFFDRQYGLSFHNMQPHGTKAVIRIPKYVHF